MTAKETKVRRYIETDILSMGPDVVGRGHGPAVLTLDPLDMQVADGVSSYLTAYRGLKGWYRQPRTIIPGPWTKCPVSI